ncbi:hypothetical protein WJX72_000577 [[Myrmecia] bisecta]|uniref:Angio-associated migratory cell protein n=1 Tax=[Myrmecia] bisecta TaxID=41462 RepID=A0AAW1PJ60_9CHLO
MADPAHYSSDEEGEHFIGGAEGVLGDGKVVAELDSEGEGQPGDSGYESDLEDDTGGAQEQEDASIHTFDAHKETVFAVAWSPAHADLVATGGGDDKAFIWRVGQDAFEQTGGKTFELLGHTDSVVSLAFNSSGAVLATGGLDGRVKLWESSSGRNLHTLEGPAEGVEWLAWHPRGDVIIAGSEDFTVWMWNGQNGACMQVFSGHSGSVRCGCFSPDGKLVVSGGGEGDASLRIWEPKTGECLQSIHGHGFHTEGLTAVAVHPDSTVAISGAEDGSVCVSNIHTGRVVGTLTGHDDSVETASFSHVQPVAVTGSVDGKLIIWDIATLTSRGVCSHPEGVIKAVCHPSAPLVYTACLDGVVRCWDLRTGVCVSGRAGHSEGVQDIAVSPDGSLVLSGSDDHTARVSLACHQTPSKLVHQAGGRGLRPSLGGCPSDSLHLAGGGTA